MPSTRPKTFRGFPQGTHDFLQGVRLNNSKAWLEEHRAEYDEFFVESAKSFVNALAPRLEKLTPGVVVEPKINGSIFRLNRDVRFSKDKQPYKDYLDIAFWEGPRRSRASSLFVRIGLDECVVGCGFQLSTPSQLLAFRNAVSEPRTGQELAALAKKWRRRGIEFKGAHYKRIPRGFPADGPAAEFLLHNALFVTVAHSPEEARDKSWLTTCVGHWRSFLPLHRWLLEHVG